MRANGEVKTIKFYALLTLTLDGDESLQLHAPAETHGGK